MLICGTCCGFGCINAVSSRKNCTIALGFKTEDRQKRQKFSYRSKNRIFIEAIYNYQIHETTSAFAAF